MMLTMGMMRIADHDADLSGLMMVVLLSAAADDDDDASTVSVLLPWYGPPTYN